MLLFVDQRYTKQTRGPQVSEMVMSSLSSFGVHCRLSLLLSLSFCILFFFFGTKLVELFIGWSYPGTSKNNTAVSLSENGEVELIKSLLPSRDQVSTNLLPSRINNKLIIVMG